MARNTVIGSEDLRGSRRLVGVVLAAYSVGACSFFAPTYEEYARSRVGSGGDTGMTGSGGAVGDRAPAGNGGMAGGAGSPTVGGHASVCPNSSTCDGGPGTESAGAAGEAGASGVTPDQSAALADGPYRLVSVLSSKCIDA